MLKENLKKYGKTSGANTLLEVMEINKQSARMKIEFINSIESALFGEFNNGQVENFPTIRFKKAHWIEWVCFQPDLSQEQQYQAACLAGEKNPIDDCTTHMMEILNVNDVMNVNLTLESLAQIHSDKVKFGQVKADFLKFDHTDAEDFFTEDQKAFLSIFISSLKSKTDYGVNKGSQDAEDIDKNSLYQVPQHLLFSHYLMTCLQARDAKTKLLYTLNAFRAIQKRITIELRELGTRDRVMGDCNSVKPSERKGAAAVDEIGDEEDDVPVNIAGAGPSGQNAEKGQEDEGHVLDNVVMDDIVDINRYRWNNQFTNGMFSTCPIIPKFHVTYGEPVDRQEISMEFEQTKDTDPKKAQA